MKRLPALAIWPKPFNHSTVSSEDIQALREPGYADGDILDALNHGARQVGLDILINAFKVKNDF